MKKILLTLITIAASGAASADIQLQIKDFRGTSTVSSNGQMARIEDGNMPGYVLVDYNSGQILMVDPSRNEAMSSTVQAQPGAASDLKISLKDRGGGQKIAGYDTRKYILRAGGQKCGTIYASKKLLANNDIRAMFESMRNMQRATAGMMGSMGGLVPVCQRAQVQLADEMESVGAPMKMLDKNGRLVSEVTRVHIGKKLPADYYDLPAGIKVVDMTEMTERAMQQTQQALEQMPDMNELMQQIQESGGQMDEGMQEQLQQMLQQLQQQQPQ